MLKNSIKALGLWFVVLHVIGAAGAISFSVAWNLESELLAISIVDLLANVVWAILQKGRLSQWSGLMFADPEPNRTFVPRWAIAIPLSVLYFKNGIKAAKSADEEKNWIAASVLCVLISFVYVVEMFLICCRRDSYDVDQPSPSSSAVRYKSFSPAVHYKTFSTSKSNPKSGMLPFDSRLTFQMSPEDEKRPKTETKKAIAISPIKKSEPTSRFSPKIKLKAFSPSTGVTSPDIDEVDDRATKGRRGKSPAKM